MILDRPFCIRRTGDDRPVSGLFAFVIRMSGWHQAGLLALALFLACLSALPLELQRRIVDGAIANSDMDLLLFLVAIYCAVVLLSGAVKLCLRLYEGWLAESAIRYCRCHLAGLYDKGSAAKSDEPGSAVSIIRAEIEQVGGFVGNGLSEPAGHVATMLVVLGYMIVVEPFIALCSAAFLLPQALLTPLMQRRVNTLTEKRISTLRKLSTVLTEADVPGLDTDELNRQAGILFRNRMRIFLWKFAGKALINFINALAPIAVLLTGGWMVIRGETELGVVVAFTSGFSQLADPLRAIIAYYRVASQTRVKHDKIAEWM